MGVLKPNSTNYEHPHESHLLDLHNAMAYNSMGEPVIRTTSGAAQTANDAFGRLRVSSPFTLFDSFHRYQDNGRINQYTNGIASSSHSIEEGCVTMTIGGNLGDKIYRESSKVFAYQPGKGLSILQTFCMALAVNGLRQRQGYFDENNGIFIERNGSEISFNIRTTTYNGTPQIRERVIQSNWNIDPLDGTGISTKTLNLDSTIIMFTDIEWLGVGSVRCGFVIDGEYIVAHVFHHSNRAGEIHPYMATACLPVRAELENLNATGVTSNYKLICTSVLSEGGYELRGRPRSVGHTLDVPRSITNQQLNTFIPMMSIRLKSDRLGAIVVPKNFSIAALSSGNYTYRISSNTITSGGSWISAGDNSSVEYNLTATNFSNGTVLEQGYIVTSNQSSASPSLEGYPFQFQLERNTFTTPPTCQEFVILVSATSAGSVACAITWEEIT